MKAMPSFLSLSNSHDSTSDAHCIAQRQRGICGGPQISWMGKAGEQAPVTAGKRAIERLAGMNWQTDW